ncbi:conserved hypothetical protein [Trichinella spiralis]|uniref:hypothetical protein n=1 Tax=Trichinella spiralis TaxID=6334 RepID=UPI0001EFDA60|nr:conserved hypothetical protein [Trichinella spiralis]
MTWKLEFEFGAEMRFQSIQPELQFIQLFQKISIRLGQKLLFSGVQFSTDTDAWCKIDRYWSIHTHTHIYMCVCVCWWRRPGSDGFQFPPFYACTQFFLFPLRSPMAIDTREDTRRMTTTSPEQLLSLAGLPGQNRSQAVLDDQQMLLRCWDCACRKELTLEL